MKLSRLETVEIGLFVGVILAVVAALVLGCSHPTEPDSYITGEVTLTYHGKEAPIQFAGHWVTWVQIGDLRDFPFEGRYRLGPVAKGRHEVVLRCERIQRGDTVRLDIRTVEVKDGETTTLNFDMEIGERCR